jgi:hypothetical protein
MEGKVHNLPVFEPYKSAREAASDHVGEINDMIMIGKRSIFGRRNWISTILVWEEEIMSHPEFF